VRKAWKVDGAGRDGNGLKGTKSEVRARSEEIDIIL
jgi:hypothetical protein